MKLPKFTTILLGLAALAGSASAAITGTFVAAQDGVNSFQSSLVSNGNPGGAFSSTTVTPGLWHDRSGGTFNIPTISPSGGYQGQFKSGALTHNEVATTLTLTPGQEYDIYMIYGVAVSGGAGTAVQDIMAGFTSGALTRLLEANGTNTGLALAAAGWVAYEQLIGTATADATTGEIKVYVDVPANLPDRSVYNGLSYVAVPEPASLALLGLGGLALGIRRRRA